MTTKLDPPTNRRRMQFVVVDPTGKAPQSFADLPKETSRVDQAGGKYGAGLIRGVSLLTRGEALGHGYWCDSVMLDQCVQLLAEKPAGLKSRFTHPGLCADGLGKPLGTFLDLRRVGDQVIADLHLKKSAHSGPEGNLAAFIMGRAEEDPEHFGTSIVFDPDFDAEEAFMLEHGGTVVYVDGWRTIEGFETPDPDNKDNLPHARIESMCACDFVDDPAANPDGVFHQDQTLPEAERLLDFAFGFSQEKPATVAFGVDPDRARQFFTNWATRRGLEELTSMPKILKHGKAFTEPTTDGTEKPKTEGEQQAGGSGTDPNAVTCPECGAVFVPDSPAEDPKPITETASPAEYAANHQRYTKAFGEVNGTKWFLEGKSFSDSQTLHYQAQLSAKDSEIATLKTDLADAKQRLAAVAKDGATPLGASAPAPGTEGGKDSKLSGVAFFQKGTAKAK